MVNVSARSAIEKARAILLIIVDSIYAEFVINVLRPLDSYTLVSPSLDTHQIFRRTLFSVVDELL